MLPIIIFSIIALLFSALFSGTEIAFISASKLRVELKREKGSRKGKILANFFEKPADFLSTMLVGNNIALVVFTFLMTQLLTPYVGPVIQNEAIVLLINTLVITVIMLIFGEFLPKTLFRLFADEILYFLAYPLKLLLFLLAIPAWIMMKLSNGLLRFMFKTSTQEAETAFTRVDLEDFIKDSLTEDAEEIDADLFGKALGLKDVRVKECMIPRTEIEDIDVNDTVEDLQQLIQETNLSRIIVTKDDIDNVLGYVHHQQLLKQPRSIKDLVLDIYFVPEAMRVRDLLNRFIKEKISIACVVDEFGGVAGIITLEDILEEIFGEIEDEHDQEEYVEIVVSDREYLFSGRLEVASLNEKYNLNFPEGEYSTLSGYLVMTTTTIPEQAAEIELNGYKFVLELVSDTKIETVRVIKMQTDHNEAG